MKDNIFVCKKSELCGITKHNVNHIPSLLINTTKHRNPV